MINTVVLFVLSLIALWFAFKASVLLAPGLLVVSAVLFSGAVICDAVRWGACRIERAIRPPRWSKALDPTNKPQEPQGAVDLSALGL